MPHVEQNKTSSKLRAPSDKMEEVQLVGEGSSDEEIWCNDGRIEEQTLDSANYASLSAEVEVNPVKQSAKKAEQRAYKPLNYSRTP